MRDAGTALVIEIERGEKQPLLRFGFNDELLFPMNRDHTVGTAKNVGSDPKFQPWFGEYARRCRTTKRFGLTERRRIIHKSLKMWLSQVLWWFPRATRSFVKT